MRRLIPKLLLLMLLAAAGVRSAHALDLDHDGMSDVWQRTYNIATGDTDSDPDHDGYTNAQEAAAGTNPHDPQSRPRINGITVSADHTTNTLSWQVVPGKIYYIYSSTDLVNWQYEDYGYFSTAGPASQAITTDPAEPRKFYRIEIYDYNYDSDSDGLNDYEEYLLGTDPYNADSDNDGMPDDWEFIHHLNPTLNDSAGDPDSDGLSNYWEYKLKLDPHSADTGNTGIPDGQKDSDYDGLTNLQEINTYHTDPSQYDTDGDGLNDGWEIQYGMNPLVDNTTLPNPDIQPDADPDGDGLTNLQEEQLGTNPFNADTDGDGYSDLNERQSGSNPTNAASTPANPGGTPGGPATPPAPTVPVDVTFGDPSGSHSEKYRVYLEPLEGDLNTQKRFRTNQKYGQTQTETFNLPKGAKYKVTLVHVGTDPSYHDQPNPDYDYELNIDANTGADDTAAITDDPLDMLGEHYESDDFYAEGQSATLFIAWLSSTTVATVPLDRTRKQLGVGEEVNLTIKPASVPTATWQLTGNKGTSTLTAIGNNNEKFVAGERACTPTTEAAINGNTIKIDFNVVEPSGVVMEQETGTGVWHIQGKGSAGFKGRPYISPNNVSFKFIEIREDTCPGTGTGYFQGDTGQVHQQGQWTGLISGDAAKPSKVNGVDTIKTNANNPPFAAGTFEWPIPWQFRVGTGGEKTFSTVTHREAIDATGKTTMSKGGTSVSREANDPSSNF